MNNVAYELEHAVDVDVSCRFAWSWRTDIGNWDDPPARFSLDGPFADGSWGTTVMPGQEPLRWRLLDVRFEQSFVVEMPLNGATLRFEWRFDALSADRMRLTQRVVLTGDNSAAYVVQVREGFEPTIASGMARLATSLEAAEASAKRSPSR